MNSSKNLIDFLFIVGSVLTFIIGLHVGNTDSFASICDYLSKVGYLTLLNLIIISMIIVLSFLKSQSTMIIKQATLTFMYIVLFYIIHLSRVLTVYKPGFNFVEYYNFSSRFCLQIIFGIDGFSICLMILTAFLFPLCIISIWDYRQTNLKKICLAFLLLEWLTLNVFMQLNILCFYVFFESVLIPMVYIIGSFGSRGRRIYAAYKFFFYTLAGSLITLLGIISLAYWLQTLNIIEIVGFKIPYGFQIIWWFLFFTAFAVKIPMIPIHTWLPEAHAEAPTQGSVILAGVMLKLGAFGFIRISYLLFPIGGWYFAPVVYTLSVLAVIYISLVAIRQVDLKRIIAYSSVAHMGFVTAGIFSFNTVGIAGAYYIMISHGLVASALFFCIGILYDRYQTRSIYYFSGLSHVMPIFSSFFLFFLLANSAIPGTSSFIGEFLVITGCLKTNKFLAFLLCLNAPLVIIYSLWLFNRVAFGSLSASKITHYLDLSKKELFILSSLAVPIILLGIFPGIILNFIEHSSILLELRHFDVVSTILQDVL